MQYFTSEAISDRVIRISDFLKNCCYLVIGEQRACLLDTLDGFGNIRAFAEQLTDKPIFVILTHGHIDHGAGCCFFKEVYMHHNDIELFQQHCSLSYRLERYQDADVTKNIPLEDYNPMYDGEFLPIEGNQEFDLGNLTIRMLAAPGHTQGMMVPLIKEERMVIFGDACGVGVLLFGPNSSCVSDYRKTLMNLKTVENEYDTILRNHGTFCSPKELLDNVIECCDDILQGRASGQKMVTHGIEFNITKPVDANGDRLDGKQGNIKYTSDKAH